MLDYLNNLYICIKCILLVVLLDYIVLKFVISAVYVCNYATIIHKVFLIVYLV